MFTINITNSRSCCYNKTRHPLLDLDDMEMNMAMDMENDMQALSLRDANLDYVNTRDRSCLIKSLSDPSLRSLAAIPRQTSGKPNAPAISDAASAPGACPLSPNSVAVNMADNSISTNNIINNASERGPFKLFFKGKVSYQ
jgi:hypothetical protein